MALVNDLKPTDPTFIGKLERPVVGFASKAMNPGECGEVCVQGFFTSVHGDFFHTITEQVFELFLPRERLFVWNAARFPIFLVQVWSDGRYAFFAEPPIKQQIRIRSTVNAGDPVTMGQVSDIVGVEFPTIRLDAHAALIFGLSYFWRHGIYFDFRPVTYPETAQIDLKALSSTLAAHFLELAFSRCYREDSTTSILLEHGWFPYSALVGTRFDSLYDQYGTGQLEHGDNSIFEKLPSATLEALVKEWKSCDQFNKHMPFFEHALKAYLAGDWLSAVSDLMPRIEGVLQLALGEGCTLTQGELVEKLRAAAAKRHEDYSLFLWSRFADFLTKFYFQAFDLSGGEVPFSRHSHGHGVSDSKHYTQRTALQLFLILDQIRFCTFSPERLTGQ